MKFFLTIALGALVAPAVACTSATQSPAATASLADPSAGANETRTNSHGVSVSVPEGWEARRHEGSFSLVSGTASVVFENDLEHEDAEGALREWLRATEAGEYVVYDPQLGEPEDVMVSGMHGVRVTGTCESGEDVALRASFTALERPSRGVLLVLTVQAVDDESQVPQTIVESIAPVAD